MSDETRYFIGTDCSSHTYLVPLDRREEWDEWSELPENDKRAWTEPSYAERLGGGLLTFTNPRIE